MVFDRVVAVRHQKGPFSRHYVKEELVMNWTIIMKS